MVQYKLVYFNLRGRAELCRLIFAAAGEKYEDVRVEKEKWPEMKASTPFGQLPYLEVHEDGGNVVHIAQSLAMARYLARQFGLDGKTPIQKAEVDMYADQITDMVNDMVAIHHETDEARKKALEEKMQNEKMPSYMKSLEVRLAKNGTGYFVGDSLTWVDLYLSIVLEWLRDKKDALLAHFAQVKAHDERVRSLPKIAEWIAKRPVTDM